MLIIALFRNHLAVGVEKIAYVIRHLCMHVLVSVHSVIDILFE